MKSFQVRQAWREKLAICILIGLLSAFGPIICPKESVLSVAEINALQNIDSPIVYAYGRMYQIAPIVASHISTYGLQKYQFQPFLGSDVSALFYKQNLFSYYCPGLDQPAAGWDNIVGRPKKPVYSHLANDSASGQQKLYLEYMNKYSFGRVVWPLPYIQSISTPQKRLIVIGRNVYDVSAYFNSQVQFLGPYMESLFANFYGQDATKQWQQVVANDPKAAQYLNCINNLFYVGSLDERQSMRCLIQYYVLLAFTALLCLVICVKFFAAIRCVGESAPETYDKHVIINIPVYSEGLESLAATIDAVARTQYENDRKLLFIIADGMVTGSGNDFPTPTILLDFLKPSSSLDPPAFMYESLGEGEDMVNRAKVYSGIYRDRTDDQGSGVPFIVVVKTGNEGETGQAGNRGKRDSQLVLMRLLSRAYCDAAMSPLEIEILRHFIEVFGTTPQLYEYMLMVDADTVVYPDSLRHLVATMIHDTKIVGLCGETLIANDQASWVTMIQVYEYYISHHLSKAFESMFGSVTCLPGCFCFYRLRTMKGRPLLISPKLVRKYARDRVDTLHMKNLLQLGEDRYLTTLVLSSFPYMKICFNARAKCKTIVPDQWQVLLSQRRRWINSTVHNLWELMSLKQLCGCCLCSMRFVIFMDLFSTVLQPAGILYLVYLVYTLVTSSSAFPLVSVVMLAGAYGLQVLIFLAKREWAQIGWLIIYLLALPVVGFVMPLYSFWHFDDFRWGKTRATQEAGEEEGAEERAGIVLTKYQSPIDTGEPIARENSVTMSLHSKVRNWKLPGPGSSSSSEHSSLSASMVRKQPLRFPAPSVKDSSSEPDTTPEKRESRSTASQLEISVVPHCPTDAEIMAELRCLINDANLSTTTTRSLRLALESKFGVDLSHKKEFISNSTKMILGL
ncbi:hypothetical protein HDV03_000026 [Kappamyces sp. JEL0829]|nr:hypothetical protein HDV03_000026 [Kappamyces sp. JEL0829]